MYAKNDIESLILRYLTGEALGEDIILLSEWLKTDEKNELIFHQIKEYWDGDVAINDNSDGLQLYDKVRDKIKTSQTQANPSIKKRRGLIYVAASIAAVFIGLFIWFNGTKAFSETHHYSLISGEAVSEFFLPDSTRIFLNKNSKLTYDNTFGNEYRKVQIEGEVYFDVTRDEQKKFIVDMDGSTITVLGTSFTVKNRVEEDYISALLVEGSIKFEADNQNIILAPNQKLVYNKSNNFLSVNDADIEVSTAWKANLIRYKSLAFSEVMKMLEEHYAVKILINNDRVKDIIITGAFDRNMTVEQILNIMKRNIGYKVRKIDNVTYDIIQ